MNKEFVTYEQALALKELGFNEPCFSHYNPNGVFMWKIMCSDEDNDHTLSIKDIMEHKAEGYVECPLKQQAFKWFREKYQLFQEIQIDQASSPKFCFKIVKFVGNPINLSEKEWYWEEVKVVDWFLYRTYEEAEQACLNKLIEIIKNK